LLHVSTVPDSLPCRKTEFNTVYNHLSAAIMEGTVHAVNLDKDEIVHLFFMHGSV
jgi:hypothetical protein